MAGVRRRHLRDSPTVMNRRERRRLKVHLEEQLDGNLRERQCGECSGCCTVLDIPVLDKPAGVTCKHVAECGGCSIYGARPTPCKEYQCGWRLGVGSLEQRPDRVGVVFSPTLPGTLGHPAFLVHEMYPDAFVDAWELLNEVAGAIVLLLIHDGLPKRVLGPEDRINGMGVALAEMRRLNAERRARKQI